METKEIQEWLMMAHHNLKYRLAGALASERYIATIEELYSVARAAGFSVGSEESTTFYSEIEPKIWRKAGQIGTKEDVLKIREFTRQAPDVVKKALNITERKDEIWVSYPIIVFPAQKL